jgi:hypothetical protein
VNNMTATPKTPRYMYHEEEEESSTKNNEIFEYASPHLHNRQQYWWFSDLFHTIWNFSTNLCSIFCYKIDFFLFQTAKHTCDFSFQNFAALMATFSFGKFANWKFSKKKKVSIFSQNKHWVHDYRDVTE